MSKTSRAKYLRLLSLKDMIKNAELTPEEKKQARAASTEQIIKLAAKMNNDPENESGTWTAEASCIEEDGVKVPVIKIEYNKNWPDTQKRRGKLMNVLMQKFRNKVYVYLDKEFMQYKEMFLIPCFDHVHLNCKEASADSSKERYNPCYYFLQRIQPKEWPMENKE